MALPSAHADEAVRMLLQGAMRLHAIHLATKRHAEHVALNAAYEKFTELADSIAEQAIGAGWPVLPEAAETQGHEVLRGYRRILASIAEQVEDPVLKNTLEEAVGEIDQLVYRASLT